MTAATENAFRFRYQVLHGVPHVRVRVFAGPGGMTLGYCGTLTLRIAEWDDLRAGLLAAAAEVPIELIDDNTQESAP